MFAGLCVFNKSDRFAYFEKLVSTAVPRPRADNGIAIGTGKYWPNAEVNISTVFGNLYTRIQIQIIIIKMSRYSVADPGIDRRGEAIFAIIYTHLSWHLYTLEGSGSMLPRKIEI